MRAFVAALVGFTALAAGGSAARAADWSLVLDGGERTKVQGTCSGTFTFTFEVSGPATSSEHGFGQFVSNVNVTFSGGNTVTAYTESFTATFAGGVTVTGTSTREGPLTGSCANGVSVQGNVRTTITAPTPRTGTSKVVITAVPADHLNDFTSDPPPPPPPDNDGDGFNSTQDCNDADSAIHPGAREVPGNSVDENCDGVVESGPPADRDGDGFSAPHDCDDANSAVRPGAREIRGNAIDENCDGVREPFPRVGAAINTSWNVGRAGTRVTHMSIRDIPARGRIRASCSGAGRCLFRTITTVPRGGSLDLTRRFGRRALRPGTVIEIRVTAAEMIGKVVRFTVRRGRAPSTRVLCLPPAARTPRGC
jgi:hypothetical protein